MSNFFDDLTDTELLDIILSQDIDANIIRVVKEIQLHKRREKKFNFRSIVKQEKDNE